MVSEFSFFSGQAGSLVDLLRERARHRPEGWAYSFLADGELEAERLTYCELDLQARTIAAALQERGLAGQRALLLYPPGLEFIAAFFGCLYADVVAVPLYPPRSNRVQARLLAVFEDARPAAVLTTSPILARFAGAKPPPVPWLATDALAPDLAAAWRHPAVDARSLAFLQYTSGSTALPKGVMVSHGNLLHNEEMIRQAFGQSERSVIVSWLPLYHDMGLIGGVLQPLYVGAPCVLMSPVSFLQRPLRWLEAISRYRATTSGGPNFAYELCARKLRPDEPGGPELDLSSWTVAFNGAEPVRADSLARFAEAFASSGFRREAFFPCYGLAEATLFVTGGSREEAPAVEGFEESALEHRRAVPGPAGRRLVGCGRPWLGQRVAIVDPESGEPCAPGDVGEVWVQGPSVAGGYWQRSEETERTFRARLAGEDGDWLRTGDLGFLLHGELFITGRLKDLIIIRGRNHYPQDIELTIERSHPAFRPGCGAAFPVDADGEERLVVVQEVERHLRAAPEDVAETARRAVAEAHELQLHELVMIQAGTLPKTSSGKVQRQACRALYLNGELTVVARSRLLDAAAEEPGAGESQEPAGGPEGIETILRRRLAAVLGLRAERIDPRQPLTRFGLDSLTAIELSHALESELGTAPSLARLLEGASLSDLAADLAGTAPRVHPEPVLPAPPADEGRLGHGQRALWFIDRLAGESSETAAYNLAGVARVAGLRWAALERALTALARRHPALRTTFFEEGGEPRQRMHERLDPDFQVEPAADWDEARLSARLREEADRPFDLAAGPLLRVRVFERASGDVVVLLAIHHIVSDFWSLGVLVRELAELYASEVEGRSASLPPLSATYAGFVSWQERLLAGPRGEQLWRYWQEQLGGRSPALDLPTDRPRPAIQTYRGAARTLWIEPGLLEALRSLGRSQGATLYMTLLAAFQVLLARYSRQPEVWVGSPTAGRPSADFAGMIGYFVNPVVLRGDLGSDPELGDWLGSVRRTVLGAFEHQELPFVLLAERLQPERDLGRSPLFQAMLVLQKAPRAEDEALALFALGEAGGSLDMGGLVLAPLRLERHWSQFDLTLVAAEVGGRLGLSLEHNSDLFDGATAERMLRHLAQLLESAASEPACRVESLPLLDPSERQEILVSWNAGAGARAAATVLHELVEAQAARTPDAPAVVCDGLEVTYRELSRRAGLLAAHLRSLGVAPERRVGVFLERSADLVVALLAVLESGGAYVPLDPAYPRERVSFMLEDSGASVLISQEGLRDRLPASALPTVWVDGEWGEASGDSPPPGPVDPRHLAYIIYTSGSTGRPKGVAIEHHSAVALVEWAAATFGPGELAGVLASTSVCFDLSVFELFATLSLGGTVVLVDSVLDLPRAPAASRVTLVNTVPSAASELVRLQGLPPGVRTVCLAGEALPRELADRLHALPGVERVFNLYGPSEDTTYSTGTVVPRGGTGAPPIGRPIPGTRAYVLSRAMAPVPVGVSGEILLGGEGLARGYLGRPELTAERFIPDSLSGEPGARLYRTGDLGRHLPGAGGELDYLGRIDNQVKIRGFRIELGEVEAVLASHPAVREVAVVARRDGQDRRLVACVVLEPSTGPETEILGALRQAARERLPVYMLPSAFVTLSRLPLTPNGKVDRRALAESGPALWQEDHDRSYTAPRTPVEELLAGVWADVLGMERVGAEDDFFKLGGHSLRATQVVARLREALGIELPLREMFSASRLSDLAAAVERLRGAGRLRVPPIVSGSTEGELPLSFAQERLWFLDQLAPGDPAYNMPAAVRLEGRLDLPALAAALEEVVARHGALRTTFSVGQGSSPVQVVAPSAAPRRSGLPVVDLGGLPAEARSAAALQLIEEEARRPFRLATGPLLRTTLLRLGEQDQILLLTLHHIVADGWSLGILVRELAALYPAASDGRPSPLPALPVQYGDYAVWQRRWLTGETLDSLLGPWEERLAGAPQRLDLPFDRRRPETTGRRGGFCRIAIPAEVTAALGRLGRQRGATLFMTLLAGFEALLSRLSGQEDFLLGTVVANRTRVELEGLIGFFVNTLVLRADLSGDPTFEQALARAREITLDAYAHQDLPFEKLVERLSPERDLGGTPLFQVLFTLQNGLTEELRLPGLALRRLPVDGGAAKFPLSLSLEETADGLGGSLGFDRGLFDEATVERLLIHWQVLLEGAAERPGERLSDLPLLTAAERRQLLEVWSGAARPRAETCVHELFAARAATRPEAPAVLFPGGAWTYRELDGKAARLARRLRNLGVGPEVFVGICLERSPELVTAVLGVLKAGGAYLPIDPVHPIDYRKLLLTESGARAVVTRDALRDGFSGLDLPMVLLDGDQDILESLPAGDPEDGARAGHPAYLLYTSGSTGRPKGVVIEHGSLGSYLSWVGEWLEESGIERLPLLTRLSFDASLKQIFWPLLSGRAVVVVSEEAATRPELLLQELRGLGRTGLNCVPSLWRAVLDQIEREPSAAAEVDLRLLAVGGEASDREMLDRTWRAFPDLAVWNLYGPTEATANASYTRLTPGRRVTLGRPIGGARLYVADHHLQPAPAGVPGELLVGGTGVARGYLGRPDLTAERFVPDPWSGEAGSRLYRTGDRVRLDGNGDLEFLGRLDHQIKIRGLRIEPGEVEQALRSHPDLRDAVVLARVDDRGEGRLAAWAVPQEEPWPSIDSLRRYLQARLPAYLVPSDWVRLAALPLLPNGKVDLNALPAPDHRPGAAEEDERPRTPLEDLLAGLWAGVLGGREPGLRDNFFEQGGHSLLATQLLSRVRDACQVDLPLRRLFADPTLAGLAAAVEESRRLGSGLAAPPLGAAPRDVDPPLSFAQERLWFLERWLPGRSLYNMPAALVLEGGLDERAFAGALDGIVRRHEVLRTTFEELDGEPRQRIHPGPLQGLTVVDLRSLPEAARRQEAGRLSEGEAKRPFDLARGPLLRTVLLRLSDEERWLLLTLHHIVSDGWSMGVLVREIGTLYRALRDGGPVDLPALAVQYADFASWQRQWLRGDALERQLAFWRQRLVGAPSGLELPTDRPRPAQQTFLGRVEPLRWSADLTRGLEELGRGATLFMTLLSGFGVLLSRYGAVEDLVVGSPVANRNHSGTEGLIGFFVNILPLRIDLSGSPGFGGLLARTRETALSAYDHQDLPFEKLVAEIETGRSLNHNPLFQVALVWQNAPMPELALPGLRLIPREVDSGTAKFDLTLSLRIRDGEVSGALEYDVDLFDRATAQRLLGHLQSLMEGAVSDPDASVWDLSLLSEGERHQLVSEWNDTRGVELTGTIHGLFEAQAARTPEAPAAVCGSETLSYRDLNARANRLARYLRRLGVGPEVLVGVFADRTLDMVVGLLGVLKAGGAYVPLDPRYPAARVELTLSDCRAPVVVVGESVRGSLPEMGARVVSLDSESEAIGLESAEDLKEPWACPDNLSYVIYTSGSTGRPKGVAIAHRSAVTLIGWSQAQFGRESLSSVLASTSICFDLSVFELFVPLSCGGRFVLVDNALDLTPQTEVSLVNTVPSAASELVRAGLLPASVRTVNLAGEALVRALADQLYGQETVDRIFNLYGPSEDTTYSTYARMERRESGAPSIGRPITETSSYVVGRHGELAGVGVAGELLLGGGGLARGYLGRPELTAVRFVPDPFGFEAGGRLYRTGDLVRWRVDGSLEFLGRLDHQVKVRGFRIELGEIESALLQLSAVREAVVVAREDSTGDRRLVAYVADSGGATAAGMRDHLLERLPAHMVPSAFVLLESLPRNANGKIDRKALPNPEHSRERRDFTRPRTSIEREVAALWQEILNIQDVSIFDNFFELGGHSLLAVRVISRLGRSFNVELSVRTLFERPTVEGLAQAIVEAQAALEDQDELARILEKIRSLSPEDLSLLEDE